MPTMDVAKVMPNAIAYNDRPSRARATVGIAVVTAIASNATCAISINEPIVSARHLGAKMLTLDAWASKVGQF
jgi:hypothetical protein